VLLGVSPVFGGRHDFSGQRRLTLSQVLACLQDLFEGLLDPVEQGRASCEGQGRRAEQDRRLRRQRRDLTSIDVDVGDWHDLTKNLAVQSKTTGPKRPMMLGGAYFWRAVKMGGRPLLTTRRA
jgi:hypothetical protein